MMWALEDDEVAELLHAAEDRVKMEDLENEVTSARKPREWDGGRKFRKMKRTCVNGR